MKVKAIQAYYKGRGTLADGLIRFWTRSKYSHSEIIIDGVWYSSSARDGGARSKIFTPNPQNWDYEIIEIDLTWSMYVFQKHKGKGYDWLGIALSQIIPINHHHKHKVFCSELNANMRLLNKPPNWYSPQRLSTIKPTNLKQNLTKSVIDQHCNR